MRAPHWISASVFVVFSCTSALGLTRDENAAQCSGNDPDLVVVSCTTLIESGIESKANLVLEIRNLGLAYYRLRLYAAAAQQFDKALALVPQDVQLLLDRGLTKCNEMSHSNCNGALADYNAALMLNPVFADAYMARGGAYYSLGKFDSAIQDYNTVIKFQPDNYRALANRGRMYFHKNELDLALDDINRAIDADPTLAEAYTDRGVVLAAKGELESAIRDYDRALSLDPSLTIALYLRGTSKLKHGDAQAGAADINAAKRLYPDIEARMIQLGLIKP